MRNDSHRNSKFQGTCLLTCSMFLLYFLSSVARADSPLPPGNPSPWLGYWAFDDTNTWTSILNYPPRSFTNLSSSFLGDGEVLIVDSTNNAWINYNITESSGTNNLALDVGTTMFWFAPLSWASTNQGGTGPGVWSRLIDVGSYTTNASYGWW